MNDEPRLTDDAAPTATDDPAPTTPDTAPTTPDNSTTSGADQPAGGFAQAPPPPFASSGSRSGPGSWGTAGYGASAGGGALAGTRGLEDSRTWALGAHVSALLGGFLGGLPAFVGPLVVWMTRRDTDPFAAEHGREALNFNLSVALYAIVLVALTVITFGFGLVLALPLGLGLGAYWLVASIVAAVKAGNGEPFRYPLTIPFVS